MKLIHYLFIFTFALLIACRGAPKGQPLAEEAPTAPSTAEATAVADPDSSSPAPATAPVQLGETPSPRANFSPIDDAEATRLMISLLESSAEDALTDLQRIVALGDERFVPVLLELFRARQLNLSRNLEIAQIISALIAITGEDFGQDLWQWIEWYGATDIAPPEGFTGWKGRILAELDPAFAVFMQDRHPVRLRVEEIMWGGVVVDGIPALDNPNMLAAAEAGYLNPWDPIFGLEINGDARAYPLRIVDWHEMVNDVIGEVPVSLAYCTLCGAAIAYDGRSTDEAGDPITYNFGSSGLLYRSNKLMYDRQTQTLWNQLTGEPVLGPLAATDLQLNLLPVVLTTWDDWQRSHPTTVVLAEETGYSRPYLPGAAYGHYFADERTMFPVWQRSAELAAKSQVYTLNLNEMPKAYPLELLTAAGVVNDELAGTELVLVANDGLIAVEDGVNQYIGPVTYQAGATVRAYQRDGHTFVPGADAGTVLDEIGNIWQVTESALIAEDGAALSRINGHLAYWFGWYAFYPQTLIYAP